MNLTDYRAVLASTGEVEVGAFARLRRRKRMLVAAIGILLMVTAGVLYWNLRSIAGGRTHGQYPALVQCTACKFQGPVTVASGQAFPLICPKCRERACQQLWKCRSCGSVFLPPPDAARSAACPDCRSTNVGSAAVP